jgi:hypothetical protein
LICRKILRYGRVGSAKRFLDTHFGEAGRFPLMLCLIIHFLASGLLGVGTAFCSII